MWRLLVHEAQAVLSSAVFVAVSGANLVDVGPAGILHHRQFFVVTAVRAMLLLLLLSVFELVLLLCTTITAHHSLLLGLGCCTAAASGDQVPTGHAKHLVVQIPATCAVDGVVVQCH